MRGALSGYAIILFIIAIGYMLGRFKTLGPQGRHVLSRLSFTVGTPALLFTQIVDAKLSDIFSLSLSITFGSSVLMCIIYAVIARFAWGRGVIESVVGGLCSGYANAGNLGIPIATYMLGTAAFLVPIQLFQMVVMAPIALAIMDVAQVSSRRREAEATRVSGGRSTSVAEVSSASAATGADSLAPKKRRINLLNPISIASLTGILLAAANVNLPVEIIEPLHLVAHMAVPVALIGFGISIAERRGGDAVAPRRDVALSVVLKTLIHPLLAGLGAAFILGISGRELLMVVMIAGFPTAQNVWVYASQYARSAPTAPALARDAAMLGTLITLPTLLVVQLILGS